MGSNAKKKTTMAKLNRESKKREKRLDKQARKDARKQAAANGVDPSATEEPLEGEGPLEGEDSRAAEQQVGQSGA
jgi:hypothetical protein